MASPSLDGLVFSNPREVKQGTSHARRQLKFFLHDQHGNEHLAAVGEDQGDAHYLYRSADAFGARFRSVTCHNKREMYQW